MNKLFYLLILLFIANCSLDTKTGFWTKSEIIKSEDKVVEKKLFADTEIYEKEFNSELKIRLKKNFKKNSFVNNLSNNNGIVKFNGDLKNISKYKFSKISQFDYYQPELLVTEKNTLIFFDEKGTILNFSNDDKLIWKSNIYSKIEKKQNPILYFASNEKILIVADSIAKYYAVNLNNGNLIWSKSSSAPFNSQVKIFKDMFFVVDFENILRCFSLKDGREIWNIKTERSFIKSQQKLSFIINNNSLVFINTLGDLSSIDIETGNLIWQTPTQSSAIYENYFSLKNSDLIIETHKQIDIISNQLNIQSKSFDEVIKLAKNKTEMLSSLPSIQPVSNKDLKRMVSGFGPRIHPIYKTITHHDGMDFTAAIGTPIYATADGTVEKSTYDRGGYGKHIIINHGYGYKTLYAHMNEIKTKRGTKVKRFDIIGYVGNTGLSLGSHLHYEVHHNGIPENPSYYYHADLTPDEYNKLIELSSKENQSFD